MYADELDVAAPSASRKATGELKAPTGALSAATSPREPTAAGTMPTRRDFTVRVAELVILLAAILGAVALGLGISKYLREHRYVAAYLLAYAVFRFADLLVRDEAALGLDRERFARRLMYELPLLALFFAAPFERTYIYGGEPSHWLGVLGLLIELAGLWIVLGARIQLGFFSRATDVDGAAVLVRNGLYRFVRHPIYAGEFLVLMAWPFEYGAPITLVVAAFVGLAMMRGRMRNEEAALFARFGDAYAEYRRVTDYVIPNVW
jgi:protein-S-isoprenylcysteine O-methyltransferase Ste14